MPKITKVNEVDYIILGILNHEPMSGYDIKGKIEREISYFYPEIGLNQIYPSLKKLEKNKLLIMKLDNINYPPKKIYSLTNHGKEELIIWLTKPLKITKHGFTLMQEFLVKLHFSGILPNEIVQRNILTLEQWLTKIVDLFEKYKENLEEVYDQNKDHRFYLMSLLFGKTIYKALFNWTQDAKDLLETR
ncbi:MAG: PadR family transcriptional regulator [Candidatus Heimdallarchaeota archaeon]|nr:PadR family transcriptional regulator [Candidatus Heimdallarchaeota archaeon]